MAVINNVTYTEITAPIIERSIFSSELGIGNCVSASCTFSVKANSANIPKAAKVEIKAQVCTDDPSSPTTPEESDQISVGTFYVYTRDENKDIGMVTLQCYDAMLKANQLYITNPTSDPQSRIGWDGGKPMADCVTEIAARLGVAVDSRTQINTGQNYKIQYPAHYIQSTNVNTQTNEEITTYEQTSNYTMADVLRIIGAVHGGNWVISPANELRLIPLVRPPSSSTSRDGSTASGNPLQMVVNVPIVIGKITTGKQITVSRVTVTRADKEIYTKGNDTGFTLQASGSQYETVALHETARDALYNSFVLYNSLTYNPFTVEKACMDPCAELGDQVYIKAQSESSARVLSVICSQVLTFGTDFRVNLSAPAKVEAESEYPLITQSSKMKAEIEQVKATSESLIEQTNNRISLEVTKRQNADTALSGRIDVTAEQIALEVTNRENADTTLSSRIQQNADQISLKVSKSNLVSDMNSELTVTNNAISVSTGHFLVNATADPSTVNFKLDSGGNIWAKNANLTNANVSGTVTSTSGSIGGLVIHDEYLKHGSYVDSEAWRRIYTPYNEVGDVYVGKGGIATFTTQPWGGGMAAGCQMTGGFVKFKFGAMYMGKIGAPDPSEAYNRYALFDCTDSVAIRIADTSVSIGTEGSQHDGYIHGNLYVDGDLDVYGENKYRVVSTENYGKVGLSAMESTVSVFADIGSGKLDDTGRAYCFISPDFCETVDLTHEYQVFITQTSTGGIERTEKLDGCFVVYGEPDTTFDWIVYARQKDNTSKRLERVDRDERNYNDTAGQYPESFGEDTIEESAEEYLRQYEEEIYGHDY